ncbi:transcriptional regulator, TetR family [Geomicrobium sp. JCM 19037]|uniref:TetR/AcrR family transcriptional regulator n=1 Tax=Geomicrobium sp. JCM 19037 TaxID=1460634 RepID=UPI00045F21A7|nr:TetR/AcrR family transcriptional regulator [Geomicrobium sp. JCM 19037]GAK05152.1 transcriptional regulator, TetR family [Geomicrobium sp. JCM 19037]
MKQEAVFAFNSEMIEAQVEDELLVQKNHTKLIEAATELFSKHGYHATTIRQIVKHSGIGIGSIYQYVTNKEEILVLILEYILKRYEYQLHSGIDSTLNPKDKLIAGIDHYYRIIDQEYEKVILAYVSSKSLSKKYREYIKELELKTNKIYEDILQEGVNEGVFKSSINVSLVAYDIIILGHMWGLKQWYFRSRMSIDEYIDEQQAHIRRMISVE